MLHDALSTERDVIQQVVVNMANCSSRQAAAAARASQSSHNSQLAGVQQLRHALAICCWTLGLPGKCWADSNRFEDSMFDIIATTLFIQYMWYVSKTVPSLILQHYLCRKHLGSLM